MRDSERRGVECSPRSWGRCFEWFPWSPEPSGMPLEEFSELVQMSEARVWADEGIADGGQRAGKRISAGSKDFSGHD